MANEAGLERYRWLHDAMRQSAQALVDATNDIDPDDRPRARALAQWYDGFVGELKTHHRIEDEVFFPELARRVRSWPEYGNDLAKDHEYLDELLGQLGRLLHGVAAGYEPAWTLDQARDLAAELRDHLVAHLGFEDDDILPMMSQFIPEDVYDRLDEQAVKMTSLSQMRFTAPWLLASLDAEKQRRMLAAVPKALTVLWWMTRRGYLRLADHALGTAVPAVR